MSFNAKNLSYDAKEPAFLQRLRGQYGNTSGLERPISRRPQKKKSDDDDDQPTYVDEESNEVISREEYEALVNGSNNKPPGESEKDTDEDQQPKTQHNKSESGKEGPASKQNLAAIGGPRKRKQVKVIGEDSPAPEDDNKQPKDPGLRKPKQKKKKIKLSFED